MQAVLPTQANKHEIEGRGKEPIPELWYKPSEPPEHQEAAFSLYEFAEPTREARDGRRFGSPEKRAAHSANKHEIGAQKNVTVLSNTTKPSQPQGKRTYSQSFPYLVGPDNDFMSQKSTPVENREMSPGVPSIAFRNSDSTMVTDSASGGAPSRMDAFQVKMNKIRARSIDWQSCKNLRRWRQRCREKSWTKRADKWRVDERYGI